MIIDTSEYDAQERSASISSVLRRSSIEQNVSDQTENDEVLPDQLHATEYS